MITRYTLPEMGKIWTDENRFKTMLDVEIAACEAMAEYNQIPRQAARKIRRKAKFKLSQVAEYEKVTKHDVTAFLKSVARSVGPEARFIHKGLTSSDVLDTALSVQIRQALDLLIESAQALISLLRKMALRYKNTPIIGRSHGVHAEPTTLGLKFLLFYEEFKRGLLRLEAAREVISVGKMSGAVGTYANVDPRAEKWALKILGLRPAPVSTQILQRDRHAEVLTAIAILGGSLEKLATEIRHLQKTETLELEEPFSEGQTGSSAMPHKRNPVNAERIAGLARILRGNALAALENIALWHERDITHSSVERVILPDSFILAHFMLSQMQGILKGLTVYPENMRENIEKTRGLIFSQRALLALIDKGFSRDAAYELVQKNAMKVWRGIQARRGAVSAPNGRGNPAPTLKDLLLKERGITSRFTRREIEEWFKLDYHLRHVDTIFRRVLKI